MDERSLVHFADNPEHLLRAYVESKEGIDRAGGFAVQVFCTLFPEDWSLSNLSNRVWEVP